MYEYFVLIQRVLQQQKSTVNLECHPPARCIFLRSMELSYVLSADHATICALYVKNNDLGNVLRTGGSRLVTDYLELFHTS